MGDTVLVSELLCRTEQIERKGTSDLLLLFDRSICGQIRMAHCKSFLCGALAVFLLLSLVTTKVDSIFYKKKRSFKMECRWHSQCTVMSGGCRSPWFNSGYTPCDMKWLQITRLYKHRCCKYV